MTERGAFFAAVRRGKFTGLVLRPAGPDDGHLPAVALYSAPAATHTLELDRAGTTEPGYREAARRPILRLERRPLPLGLTFWGATAIAGAVAIVAVVILLAAFGLLLSMRSM